ncbi:MAG: hypothetical protein ACRD44_12415 [Bryobacteraceae bacterium]
MLNHTVMIAEAKSGHKRLTGRIYRLGVDGLGYIEGDSRLYVFTMGQLENWTGSSEAFARLEGSPARSNSRMASESGLCGLRGRRRAGVSVPNDPTDFDVLELLCSAEVSRAGDPVLSIKKGVTAGERIGAFEQLGTDNRASLLLSVQLPQVLPAQKHPHHRQEVIFCAEPESQGSFQLGILLGYGLIGPLANPAAFRLKARRGLESPPRPARLASARIRFDSRMP